MAVASFFMLGLLSMDPSFAANQQTGTGQQGQTHMQGGQQQSQMPGTMDAQQLQGKMVKGAQGEELGRIDSVLLKGPGEPSYAILAGERNKMYPIPLRALQRDAQQDELRLNITKQQLSQAPSFDKGQVPDYSNSEWQQKVHGYYGQQQGQQGQQSQEGRQGQRQGQQLAQQGQQGQTTARERSAATVQQTLVIPKHTVSDYMDKTLWNGQGEELGRISDLVFDPQTGRITYAIVEHGGTAGIGDRETAVPWNALHADRDNLYLNIDKQRFANAPSFNRGERPNFEDQEWGNTVHSYYGETPFWNEGAGDAQGQ